MSFKRTYRRKHLFFPKDVYPGFMDARAWLTEQMLEGRELPDDHYLIEITATTINEDLRNKERVIKTLSGVTGRLYACAW